MSIKKLLIANRGEIACRVIQTCRRLGISTVAIFSEIDKQALFVQQADEAYQIGGIELSDSYLNIDKIIQIAKDHNCQAIHPGYGFLSENATFAKKVVENQLIFIGPDHSCIEMMGCKKRAKDLMMEAGVPVVPGLHVEADQDDTIKQQAEAVGYPVLIKAASGGGGKGMKLVTQPSDLMELIASAKREALKSFGDDTVIIEKYLGSPRHIEVQVFADNHGNVVHLFERDCSIQRRHQKIVEEAPALDIAPDVRAKLHQAAIQAAKAINYSGAGTIEFLLENDQFYFMEMNTRLQVEHPVSEFITNVDLVEWQIAVANNQTLPLEQQQIHCNGHAVEVRLYAEDPDKDFLPQTGRLQKCLWPALTDNIRVDSGVQQGDEISIYYDPMIAKVIAYGRDRQAAIHHLQQALAQIQISGFSTNISFLKAILAQAAFNEGQISTHYLQENPISYRTCAHQAATYLACYLLLKPTAGDSPWQTTNAWQANINRKPQFIFMHKEQQLSVNISRYADGSFESDIPELDSFTARLLSSNTIELFYQGKRIEIQMSESSEGYDVFCADKQFYLSNYQPDFQVNESSQGSLTAPMPGTVIAVNCQKQDPIQERQVLMIIEAMKMEHRIEAPFNGEVTDVFFQIGDQVNDGDLLLAIHPTEGSIT